MRRFLVWPEARAALHGVAGMVHTGMGFALLLLYGRVLEAAEFGLLALFYVTMHLGETVAIQGFTAKLLRQHGLEANDSDMARRRGVTTAYAYSLASAALLFGALSMATEALQTLFFPAADGARLFQLLCLAGFCRTVQNLPRQMLVARGQGRAHDALRLLDALIAGGLNGFLVLGAGLGLVGVVYGEILREGFLALTLVLVLRRDLTAAFSAATLRRLLFGGLPRLRRELPALVASTNDRFFLAHWGAPMQLGTYVFGFRLAQSLGAAVMRPMLRLLPALYESGGPRSRNAESLGRFVTYFVALAGLAALAFSVFAAPFLRLCAPTYAGAVQVMPLLFGVVSLAGIQHLALAGVRRQGALPASFQSASGIVALLALGGNALLVPRHGMFGAATTALLTQGILCVAAFVTDRRHFGLRLETGRLIKVAVALASSYYISGFVMPEQWIGQLAAACAVVLLYPALLGVLGFYNVLEIEKMRDLLNHRVALHAPRATPEAQAPAEGPTSTDTGELVGAGTESSRP